MRTKKGVVTSAKMTGTVTVTVHSHAFHPVYKKRYRKSKKFLADANKLDLYPGDEVVIEECRPLSKRKYFKVKEITRAAPRVSDVAEEEGLETAIHGEQKEESVGSEDGKAKSKDGSGDSDLSSEASAKEGAVGNNNETDQKDDSPTEQ